MDMHAVSTASCHSITAQNIYMPLPWDRHEVSPVVHIQSGVSGSEEICTLNPPKYCGSVAPAWVALTHFMARENLGFVLWFYKGTAKPKQMPETSWFCLAS